MNEAPTNVAILIVQRLMSEKSLQLAYMYIFQVSFWNFQFINAIIMDCYQLALMVVLQRLYLAVCFQLCYASIHCGHVMCMYCVHMTV